MISKLICVLFLMTLLPSCLQKDKNVVNVGLLQGPSAIGMVKAMDEKTYYEGKKIYYQLKDNPQHLRALLQSGNMDMAILPMTMVYNMLENNVAIKIAAITGWGNLYLLSRDSLKSFSDLEGKVISVPGEGQTPDLVSQFLIDYFSLKDRMVLNYTYPAPLLLASALAVGKVEYAVLPEPLASIALSKNKSLKRSVDLAQLWAQSIPEIPLVQSVLVVNTSFYNNNRKWFEAYLKILEANAADVIAQPLEALALASKHKLIPPSLIESDIIANSHLDFVVGKKIADDITSYLNTFYVVDSTFNLNQYLVVDSFN